MPSEKDRINTGILRYPGGKTRAIKILENFIPKCCISGRTIYSPFTGGSSFELFLANNYPVQVLASDIYEPLINFFTHLKNDRDNLCQLTTTLQKRFALLEDDERKQEFKKWKNLVNCQDYIGYDVARASLFYAINRCSFSGTSCSGGYSSSAVKNFSPRLIGKLQNLSDDYFRNINFSCQDFEDVLMDALDNDPSSLWFLDPPYHLKDANLYGHAGNTHDTFSHDRLYDILNYANEEGQEWLLCYNDSDYIRKLYNNFPIINVKWGHCIKNSKTCKSGNEIVILSEALYNHLNPRI